ncbi:MULTISPECIES: hypothetical protein, partial [Rhodomicrobium]|uniref:hypothetical protein n=1 Tax=Rhodomicrobium TaxID=1068 RepID=UPI001AECDE96
EPSGTGSKLNADYPWQGVKIACRFTGHRHDEAKNILLIIIKGEAELSDPLQPSRIVLLLRLAVAIEDYELAKTLCS